MCRRKGREGENREGVVGTGEGRRGIVLQVMCERNSHAYAGTIHHRHEVVPHVVVFLLWRCLQRVRQCVKCRPVAPAFPASSMRKGGVQGMCRQRGTDAGSASPRTGALRACMEEDSRRTGQQGAVCAPYACLSPHSRGNVALLLYKPARRGRHC